jgi:hypothetical protein
MNEETLFYLALEKPPSERDAFLQGACAGDAALRDRINAMLGAHKPPRDFLAQSAL